MIGLPRNLLLRLMKTLFGQSPDSNGMTVMRAKTNGTGASVMSWQTFAGTLGASINDLGTITAVNSFSINGLSGFTSSYVGFGAGGSPDASVFRIAAGIIGSGTGGASGLGYFANLAGDACLANNFTNATATLANTNLSCPVTNARSYIIEGELIVSNSTAGEGMQIDFNGGGATATTFDACISAVAATAPVNGTLVSAALATALTYTTVTGLTRVIVRGFLKAGSTGTFILRAAEVSHSTGTLTIQAGSWLSLRDANPL